jgi:hypothetical protein
MLVTSEGVQPSRHPEACLKDQGGITRERGLGGTELSWKMLPTAVARDWALSTGRRGVCQQVKEGRRLYLLRRPPARQTFVSALSVRGAAGRTGMPEEGEHRYHLFSRLLMYLCRRELHLPSWRLRGPPAAAWKLKMAAGRCGGQAKLSDVYIGSDSASLSRRLSILAICAYAILRGRNVASAGGILCCLRRGITRALACGC